MGSGCGRTSRRLASFLFMRWVRGFNQQCRGFGVRVGCGVRVQTHLEHTLFISFGEVVDGAHRLAKHRWRVPLPW